MKFKTLVLAVIVGFLFGFMSCDGGDGLTTGGRVVEYKYRGNNGVWQVDFNTIQGPVATLGENTLTVSGGGVNISYTGVYTQGGGILTPEQLGYTTDTATWAFLYSNSQKIGIALVNNNNMRLRSIFLGKSNINMFSSLMQSPWGMDINDMQDTHNGSIQFTSIN